METCTYGLGEGNRKSTAVMLQGADCLSYLESCYHNALYYELKHAGLNVFYNAPFNVFYRGEQVGEFYADLAVEGKVIIEIKSVRAMAPAHESQLLNYLHISRYRLGYLVNFYGERAVYKRFIL